jgi:serine/threonine protein phosphatase PrpC
MRQLRYTQAITQGRREYQEDRFGVEKFTTGTLVWVADGHGGEEASQYVQDHMYVSWVSADNNDRTAQIRDVFRQFVDATANMEAGTTLSLMFFTRDTVYAAVLGDSPLLLKTDDVRFVGPNHNARSNMEERKAAVLRGGHYANGYVFQPSRGMYLSDAGPGLQMTRALGDSEFKFLSREPEIFSFPFGQFGDYALIATDGVIDPSHHNSNELDVITDLIEGGAEAYDLVARAAKIPTNDNATAILVRTV